MKKKSAVVLVILLMLSLLSGCAKYKADDFIGKTSAEIMAQYGPFDCVLMPISEDGLYRNCRCGYTVREPVVGFLGTDPEVLFFISFDRNGIAYACEEDYRPGG